jgi:hypothetical protein
MSVRQRHERSLPATLPSTWRPEFKILLANAEPPSNIPSAKPPARPMLASTIMPATSTCPPLDGGLPLVRSLGGSGPGSVCSLRTGTPESPRRTMRRPAPRQALSEKLKKAIVRRQITES